jgi:hypothetical protein
MPSVATLRLRVFLRLAPSLAVLARLTQGAGIAVLLLEGERVLLAQDTATRLQVHHTRCLDERTSASATAWPVTCSDQPSRTRSSDHKLDRSGCEL